MTSGLGKKDRPLTERSLGHPDLPEGGGAARGTGLSRRDVARAFSPGGFWFEG